MSSAIARSRPLRVNYRDVGDNIRGIRKGKLFRSSVCFTASQDIGHLIDLRRNGAPLEPWHLDPADTRKVTRHHIPMVGRKGGASLLWALPTRTLVQFVASRGSEVVVGSYFFASADNMLDMYIRIAENASVELLKMAQIICGSGDQGVAVFCVAGKDRTGIVVSLFTRLAGASIEDIAADYAQSQVNLQKAKEEGHLHVVDPLLLDSVLTQSPWEVMVAFIRTLEHRYGSIRRFFEIKLGFPRSLVDDLISALKSPVEQEDLSAVVAT